MVPRNTSLRIMPEKRNEREVSQASHILFAMPKNIPCSKIEGPVSHTPLGRTYTHQKRKLSLASINNREEVVLVRSGLPTTAIVVLKLQHREGATVYVCTVLLSTPINC